MADSGTRDKGIGEAIGRIAAGIFIVTAKRDTEETALLASWVQQAAFEPPLVSVAVKAGRPVLAMLTPNAPFAINVVAAGHKPYVARFSKGIAPGESPFAGLDVAYGDTGSPLLPEAVAWLECRVRNAVPSGDHVLVIAEVVAGKMPNPGPPEVRFRKSGFNY